MPENYHKDQEDVLFYLLHDEDDKFVTKNEISDLDIEHADLGFISIVRVFKDKCSMYDPNEDIWIEIEEIEL